MRPQTLKDIVGQQRIKEVLDTECKASVINKEPIGHMLFTGASGVGKTTFARALAYSKGSRFSETHGAILDVATLERVFSKVKAFDIIFIDEIHTLSTKAVEYLYTIMEDYFFISKRNRKVYVNPFTLIGATTCPGALTRPFKRRFEFILNVDEYTEDELLIIIRNIGKQQGVELSDAGAEVLADTCRGNPRLAVNYTKWLVKYIKAHGLKGVSAEKARDVLRMQGVHEEGLTDLDLDYLSIVEEHGPVSISQIACKLDTDKETVMEDIEPYLLKLNKIEITPKGRITTFNNSQQNQDDFLLYQQMLDEDEE